ncbi:ABC transporter substrate-binding protein [Maritalea sp.]|uniref:ABC transporter substrate-binding protein n=1 Tax=Maritalea sp. TaxID=2003361 RepID=UPI003EF78102
MARIIEKLIKKSLFAAAIIGVSSMSAFASEIRVGLVLEPPHLDPTAGAAAAIDEVVYANVFEGLTRIDQTGAVQPSLATSWTISDDGLTYTFQLKEGVSFHDGTGFDAEDVIFTFERARADDSTNAQKGIFAPINSVKAIDPQAVEIQIAQPQGDFLFNIGRGDAVIVAPESAEMNQSSPIGTGPFKFVQWDQGSRVILERNPEYTGTPAHLDKATFVFISDPNAAQNAMLAGEIDGFSNFPAPESLAIFDADPRYNVLQGSTEGETIISINNGKAPFNNLKVRQAIAHALDRKAIIDGAMFGFGTPIGTHFAPHHPYYVDLLGTYPRDIEKAKALLAEAGYPNGLKAAFKLPPPTYSRRGGQIIAAQLREIGIELELINVEWGQWLEDVFKTKNYDLSIVSHVEPFDIGIYANPDYYFQYDNVIFQAIIEKLNVTADEAKREQLAKAAQRILSEEAVNGFLFQLAKTGVWDAKLEGMWPNSPVEGNDLTAVRWVN